MSSTATIEVILPLFVINQDPLQEPDRRIAFG